MIRSLAVVLALALAGDILVTALSLPLPGPAVGLLLLAAGFATLGRIDEGSARLFDAVAPHFPMFFIPAAVGIVAHMDLVAAAWVHIVAAITLSTAVTIIFTGWIAQMLLQALKRTEETCRNS